MACRTSQLRKTLATEAGPGYAGTKSSRKELYGEAFGQIEPSDDGSDGMPSDEDESDESNEDEEEDDDLSDGDEEIPSDGDHSEEESSSKISGTRQRASTNGHFGKDDNAHLDKESRAMLQELKKASSADIEKGRDVRKQLVSLRQLTTQVLDLTCKPCSVVLGHSP